MATQKPISTISYNTEAFLRNKLENWLEQHIIQSYMYIFHQGEDGDKDHIHLRIEPNKRIDPMDLRDQLSEPDLTHPDKKPLGIRPWRPSKEEDWILYAVHHQKYLNLKYGGGEKGEKLPYKWQDVQTDKYMDMEIAWIRAMQSMDHFSANIAIRLLNGEKPVELILQGESVTTINSITTAINRDQYANLMERFKYLQAEIERLQNAIKNSGLTLVIKDDKPFLE